MKNELIALCEKVFEENLVELKKINEYLYNNPELGHEEVKACQILTKTLAEHGFEARSNFCEIPTAFIGKYKLGQKKIRVAILAEYDALPDIGHGCGHNAFATTTIATAIILKEIMEKKGIEGEILVIGAPAEETSGTKVEMVERGVFDNIDVAIAVHPTGELHTRSGKTPAIEALKFIFVGRTAHAASEAHEGINALNGLLLMFNSINLLRTQLLEGEKIDGIISEGGKIPNIIPEIAIAKFYIRANTVGDLNQLVKKVKKCAKGAAIATNTQVIIENYEASFENLISNETLSEIYEENLKLQGIKEIRKSKKSGSTDMGNVSHYCPTIHPYFPLSKDKLISHTREFAMATVENEAYKGIKEAAIATCLTLLDVLQNDDLLSKIKKEFKNKR